ncbi:DUF5682 family protein [Streptomyces sp. NPDC012765]|uniref:DUF5682 family protein n=1 Tax=Streptomyces sp. NPDC012765 TaxID=3155249 RepID=UPI0033E012F5
MTHTAPHTDPRAVVDALAAARAPYLIGVRHHSPALAAVVPALLDASGADTVCVELPAEFQPWLEHLADPETHAPVALAGTGEDGRLAFYPFADFSPELAAIRWAHRSGATVICCDLPLADRAWTDPAPAPTERQVPPPGPAGAPAPDPALDAGTATEPADASLAGPRPGGSFADALTAAGTGRDGDDLWDRAVEVLAPGCSPEAVRRAALGVGWALRADTGSVAATDLAREAHMRSVIAGAAAAGHRVAAVIGAFHAPALPGTTTHDSGPGQGHASGVGADRSSGRADDPGRFSGPGSGSVDGLGRVSGHGSGSVDDLGRFSGHGSGSVDGRGGVSGDSSGSAEGLSRVSGEGVGPGSGDGSGSADDLGGVSGGSSGSADGLGRVSGYGSRSADDLGPDSGDSSGSADDFGRVSGPGSGDGFGGVSGDSSGSAEGLGRLSGEGVGQGSGDGSGSADGLGGVSGDSSGSAHGLGRVSGDGSADGLGRGSSDSAGCGDGAGGELGCGRGKNASGVGSGPAGARSRGGGNAVTSFVPYSFDLLDSRSGYPAGIRDPRWQQAVLEAGGDPARVRDAASVAVTGICRELRRAGHTAGTGEAAETLRLACDLAALRELPAPGRGELLEAVTTVLGQGEPLGRGRALARALEAVLVGTARGRISPHAPRSGLGPSVEAELAALRLPSPEEPAPREIRLDPLRSALDGRREVLLQRLLVCGASYGEPLTVAATGDGTALGTKWRLSWTPSVPARLDLAGVRGVTAAQAAAGTLRDTARRAAAEGGPTPAQILAGLAAAARCDLPELVDVRLHEAATALPQTATLPELLDALDLLEALHRGHLPGTSAASREAAAALAGDLLEAAVRCLPGLAGSEDPADAAALVALADRAAAHHLGLRTDDALADLAATASPMMQGAALAVRVLLDLDPAAELGGRAAGWIDSAGTADSRRTLNRRLGGLLTAAGPLLQSSPAALTPLLDRIEHLADQEFLDRLPALRGGFDALSPAARDRLLATVTERLGDRIDLALDASPALLALWAAADAAGLAALKALPLPGTPPGPDLPTPTLAPAPTPTPTPAAADDPRLAPADRWRLLLGRERDRLPAGARRYAHALDELYGAGRGEGASDLDLGRGGGQGGGQEASFPTAREWSQELEALFGADVREEVLAGAAEAGRTDVLTQLDPEAVRPSVELLSSVLSLAGGMPEAQLARLRPLVRRLVDELAKELATRLRPALSGLATPRPTRRPGGRLDLARTLRANLAHTRRRADGSVVVVPERPVFSTRASREADWRLILVVDVSGSMEASVIWSALTAAVLGGVPTLSTHFLAFSTQVVDLTDRVEDPLSLLLEVRVGGGTHIAAGLAHARSLITVPSRTLVVVVSDFEEGAPIGGLLGEVRALAASGAHLLGCAALDDEGTPRYSVPVARQLVAAGMPVAALSPLALARWVGDRLRGESR